MAKREEIMRLVAMASEEAAMAEVEAFTAYDAVLLPQPFQCVVCYCPTTMRCSQCKAVRYWFVFCSMLVFSNIFSVPICFYFWGIGLVLFFFFC